MNQRASHGYPTEPEAEGGVGSICFRKIRCENISKFRPGQLSARVLVLMSNAKVCGTNARMMRPTGH